MLWIATPPRPWRVSKAVSREEVEQALHRVADRAYTGLRQLWLRTVNAVQAAVTIEALAELFSRGTPPLIAQHIAETWQSVALPALETQLPPLIAQTVEAGARVSIRQAEAVLTPALRAEGLRVVFNAANPRVREYVQQYAGSEIRQISAETLQAVRATIRHSLETGSGLAQLARELRASIGLTERQAGMVTRYREGLVESGASMKRIGELVERKTQQLIRRRAMTIARHEALSVSVAGQHQLFLDLHAQGLLDDTQFRRRWIVARDERLCPRCRPIPGLNPDGRRLNEPFTTPVGPILHPPAHIVCRCVVTGGIAS